MECSFKVGDPDPGQLPEGAQQGGGHGYPLLRHQAVHQVHSTPSAAQPIQVSIYDLHIKNIFFCDYYFANIFVVNARNFRIFRAC